MAKQRHSQTQETSSKGSLIALAIGAILVAGLVVWALTRTVDAPATTSSEPGLATMPPVTGTTTPIAPPTTTAPITATSTQPVAANAQDGVARISAEDLREKVSGGNVVIVDVRDAVAYQNSHIAGSINLPMSSIQANLDLIPKGKDVVAYCT